MLIFLFELEMSRMTAKRIHQFSGKSGFCKELLSEKDCSVVMTMVTTLPMQFRRSLRIKKIITKFVISPRIITKIITFNAPRVL